MFDNKVDEREKARKTEKNCPLLGFGGIYTCVLLIPRIAGGPFGHR
jgi:hypothetical protein